MARTLCILIFMMAHSLYASELFWFSYKIMTQNSIVTYEQKNISPVMIPFEGKKEFLCSIPLPYASNLSKIDFLRKHFDAVLPCFYPRFGFFVVKGIVFPVYQRIREGGL